MRLIAASLAAALVLLSSASCGKDDIGAPCDVAGDTPGTIFNLQALDCRSRVCVRYGTSEQAVPRCTEACKNDDDCPSDPIGSCKTRYVCRIGASIGGLRCCKVCVCKDDTSGDTDPQERNCDGVEPLCPVL